MSHSAVFVRVLHRTPGRCAADKPKCGSRDPLNRIHLTHRPHCDLLGQRSAELLMAEPWPDAFHQVSALALVFRGHFTYSGFLDSWTEEFLDSSGKSYLEFGTKPMKFYYIV